MTPRAYLAAKALSQNSGATPAERANAAERVREHESLYGRPGARPWWTLKIAVKGSGYWLDNTVEFRNALRALRDQRKQYKYAFEVETFEAVFDGEVDWRWFPESEPEPWKPPRQMMRARGAELLRHRPIGWDEDLTEWPIPRDVPYRERINRGDGSRGGQDGELPGARVTTRKPTPKKPLRR